MLHHRYSSEEFEQVVAVCRVTEVERDRLLGLSQILQQRYNIHVMLFMIITSIIG